jgi:hypothetical protein
MTREQATAEYLRRRSVEIPNYEGDGWNRLPENERNHLYGVEATIYYECMAKVNA